MIANKKIDFIDMKLLIKIAIFTTVLELVFPWVSYFSNLKYLILAPIVYWILYYRAKKLSLGFFLVCMFIIIILFLVYGYSISVHFLVLQLLIIGSINFIYRTDLNTLVNVREFSYRLVLLLSITKILVAINIILNLNIDPLSNIFWNTSGGGIYNIGGVPIPRITFGPEILFLIGYILFNDRKYSFCIMLSLVLGFSRVYLILLAFVLLYYRRIKLFFIFIVCGGFALIGSTVFLERPDVLLDPRFMQWEIFAAMLNKIIFIGDFNFYINQVQVSLYDMGYDFGKSECESCQLMGDFGIIPYLLIISMPLWASLELGLKSVNAQRYLIVILLCMIAAFFNPLMVTLQFVIINFLIVTDMRIKQLE